MENERESLERPTYVFAFGSNLDSARMKSRVPSAVVVGVSALLLHTLRFHKRSSNDGTAKADAFRTDAAADRVEGVVYRIDEAELAELDRIEGHGSGYERQLMSFEVIQEDQTTHCQAWIYIAMPDHIDESLAPATWYVQHVLDGATEHGLSAELIAWLEAHPCQAEEVGESAIVVSGEEKP